MHDIEIDLVLERQGESRKIGNILVCPWQEALSELGLGITATFS